MARTSTYECDNCGNSIPDPGLIFKIEVKSHNLKDGIKYYNFGDDSKNDMELEVCPSCASNIRKAIQRVTK